MARELQIVLVEDNENDVDLICRTLQQAFIPFFAHRVSTRDGLEQVLNEFSNDIVLADYDVPSLNGKEALSVVKKHNSQIPFVFVSGILGEERAIETMKAGATDYVLKDHLERLPLVVQRAVEEANDHTARRKAELEREEARQAAMNSALESARLKAMFMANMSHEIRTPMNAIIGSANLLLDSALSPEQKEYVQIVSTSGESLLRLIDDILSFSKLEAGKLILESKDFDLRATLQTVTGIFSSQARSKGYEISNLIDNDIPERVRGDEGRLRQILLNLAGNAVKFTEKGEVVIQASKVRETNEQVILRIAVRDTGIGISAEAQTRLFQPFSQGDSSMTRKYGGTGLGLAISKRFIELMGGEIGLASVPEKGSTFWFTLTFQKTTESATNESPQPQWPAHARVLVIDDNASSRQSLHSQLTYAGLRAVTAEDGDEGLKLLRKASDDGDPFAIVLLDWYMPGMNGSMVAQAIRHDVRLCATKIVMMTSIGNHLEAEQLSAAGAEAFLNKPIRHSNLVECLSTLFSSQPPSATELAASVFQFLNVPRARVLIAEDNAFNQKIASRHLEKLGCTADVVTTGKAVLDALKRTEYDLVLMDCQMPEMDGYQATNEIRKHETPPNHTPIIAMTAHALEGDREKCLEAGMDDYLSKPVRPADLAAMLNRWIGVPSDPGEPAVEEAPPVNLDLLCEDNHLNDEVFRELVELYLQETASELERLEVLIRKNQPHETKILAHGCAGSSASFGAARLRGLFRSIESKCLSEESHQLLPILQQASREFKRVESYMRTILSDGTKNPCRR